MSTLEFLTKKRTDEDQVLCEGTIKKSGLLVFWKVVLWIHPRDQNKNKPSVILFASYKSNIHARTRNKEEGKKRREAEKRRSNG